MRRAACFGVISMLVLAPAVALAHGGLLSQGEYRFEEGEVVAKLVFSAQELADSVKATDGDGDTDVSAAELETEATRTAIEKDLLAKFDVRARDEACVPRLGAAALVEGGGVEMAVRWRCPAGATEATVDLEWLPGFDAGHRHLVTMLGTTSSDVSIAVAGNQTFTVSGTAGKSSWTSILLYGITHILEGWDHVLFLFALVLVGGRVRTLIAVVTAFTIGHSLSLAIATFGWWIPSPSVIEPLIALSIAWVGVENLWAKDGSKRWRITLPFGFIHGFGFAGALRDLALPPSEIPFAVLLFNLGVELGQIVLLVIMLPAILWVRKKSWFGQMRLRMVSMLIVLVGVSLFVARVLGLA